jgi:hypothetical protein
MRTLVFSDVHGEPAIITAVVEHSGFDPRTDRLIFAGDAVEVGRDSLGCLELLDELGAECLVGNHEFGVFTGWPIESEPIEPGVLRRVSDDLASGRWHLAAEADGVLITHAGLGDGFLADFESAGSAASLAERLNTEFARAIEAGELAGGRVVDTEGPLWWRPGMGGEPLPGLTQVIGHTPVEVMHQPGAAELWAARGIYLIDPWVRGWRQRGFEPPVPVRYAVIEDGSVRVVEG